MQVETGRQLHQTLASHPEIQGMLRPAAVYLRFLDLERFDESLQHICIAYLKIVKRIDLKISHYRKHFVALWCYIFHSLILMIIFIYLYNIESICSIPETDVS